MLVDPKTTNKPANHNADNDGHTSPPSRGKSAVVLLLIVLVGVVTYRWFGMPVAPTQQAEKAQLFTRSGDTVTVPEGSSLRSKLVIAPVAEQDVHRDLVLPATVEADPARLVKVAPPLAGRVTQLQVTLGQQVKAGQPLFVLDSPDLGTAYSDYDRAKAQLALAQKSLDRLRGLSKIGGAADKDLQQAETDNVNAQIEDQRATAHLTQIGVDPAAPNKSQTVTVTAPMDGSVTDLEVAPGQYWNDPTATLMTIADLASVWVTVSVPENNIALISKGQEADVTLAAYPGEVLHGHVLFISDVVDTDTRRTKVRIAFDNPDGKLRPGMFATASFHAASRKLIAVPTSALLLKDDETQVLVETAPWRLAARTVDVAFQQNEQAFLSKGVKPGDRVVVKGGVLIGD